MNALDYLHRMEIDGLKTYRIVLALLVLLTIAACDHKKGLIPPAAVPQANPCDTSSVTYALSVKPVLQNNCYSCHSTAATTNGGLDLENFASLKNYLQYYYHNDSIYGSKLSHIVNQTGTVLFMPPTGKLSKCELGILNTWIRAGAPGN